jgi:hypothetical protein
MPKDHIFFTFFFLYYLFNYYALKLCDPYMVSLVRIRVKVVNASGILGFGRDF